MADRSFLVPIVGIVIVFIALGFIQIVFQRDIQESIKGSNRNYEAIVESEQEINQTLIAVNETVVAVNETVADLIGNATEDRQRDANLTREETEQLVADIRAIPKELIKITNQTATQQSNFTAQKIATERIANITQDVREIIDLLRNSSLTIEKQTQNLTEQAAKISQGLTYPSPPNALGGVASRR